MWVWLTPLVIIGSILVVFGLLFILGRYKNGALLRPIVQQLSRIGFMRRLFTKMSTAALERQNPELASAVKKLTPLAASNRSPEAMQKAMDRLLTPAERRAYMDAAAEQGVTEDISNRQIRRHLERRQTTQQPSRSGGSSASTRPGASGRKRKRK
jgi:hypothetical protein